MLETENRHIIPFTGGFDSEYVLLSLIEKFKQEEREEDIVLSYIDSKNIMGNDRQRLAIKRTVEYVRSVYNYERVIMTFSEVTLNSFVNSPSNMLEQPLFKRAGFEQIPFYIMACVFAMGMGNNFIYLPFNKNDFWDANKIHLSSRGLIKCIKKLILDFSNFTIMKNPPEIFLPIIELEKWEVVGRFYELSKNLTQDYDIFIPGYTNISSCEKEQRCMTTMEMIDNIISEKPKPENLCVKCIELYDALEKYKKRGIQTNVKK